MAVKKVMTMTAPKTVLEKVAYAIARENAVDSEDFPITNEQGKNEFADSWWSDFIDDAHAALMVLLQCKLPNEVITHASGVGILALRDGIDPTTYVFRAICLKLAEEKTGE